MPQKYEIIEDITISGQFSDGTSLVTSFSAGEVVTPDAYLLPRIEVLVTKGLAVAYEGSPPPSPTNEALSAPAETNSGDDK